MKKSFCPYCGEPLENGCDCERIAAEEAEWKRKEYEDDPIVQYGWYQQDIIDMLNGGLTRKRYKMITEELLDAVMDAPEHEAVAWFGDYIILCYTWQHFSEVHGELEIYKNERRIFNKHLVLAE